VPTAKSGFGCQRLFLAMWLPTLKKLAMSMFSAATIVTPFVAVHGTETEQTRHLKHHTTPHSA
jgi:hypothetical protein